MSKSFRVAIFIFLGFFLFSSKMFIQTFLRNIPGALEYEAPSEKGLFISAFLMAVYFLLINSAVNYELI